MANLSLIKTFVLDKGITLKEFAQQLGMSEQGFHRILKENSTSIDTLEKIAQMLGVHPSVFFDAPTPAGSVSTSEDITEPAGCGCVTIPKEVLDMLAAKDARIAELTNMLLAMRQ